jgi:hypothetical protein
MGREEITLQMNLIHICATCLAKDHLSQENTTGLLAATTKDGAVGITDIG